MYTRYPLLSIMFAQIVHERENLVFACNFLELNMCFSSRDMLFRWPGSVNAKAFVN